MTDESKATSVAVHLKQVIAEGRDLGSKPSVAVLRSQVWIMRARGILTRLYGADSAEVDYWCPRQSADPQDTTGQNKILTRLPNLEHLAGKLSAPVKPRIFIGHGRSPEWLKLRIFFSQTLDLPCDEFNIEPAAGLQTANRIETMLASANMAFLIMTGEDSQADGTLHARQNVIHEIGLFQARLGQHRAIVMLEAGCSRFSNLDGLTTINFPAGDIMARSEQVRGVLARERVL